MKTAFMFSGQGAQSVGMGKELYDNYEVCRKLFDKSSEALGYDIREICFEKNDKINETEFSQPALLTVGMAAYEILKNLHDCDVMMGLSLGEYTALTAAGAFDYKDAIRLVQKRGTLMGSVSGGMTAVKAMPKEKIEEICDSVPDVYLANYNSYEQIVIAGTLEALPHAEELLKAAGGKCMRLKVSGPFHTPLYNEVAAEFATALDSVNISKLKVPLITNVTDDFVENDPTKIRANLKIHMLNPVKWVYTIEKAVSLGVDTFIEVGPGKALCSLVSKINGNVKVIRAEDLIWARR